MQNSSRPSAPARLPASAGPFTTTFPPNIRTSLYGPSSSSRTPRPPGTSAAPYTTNSLRKSSVPADLSRTPGSSSSNHRRALTVGTSGGFLLKNSLGRKPSSSDLASSSQQQQQQQQSQQQQYEKEQAQSRFRGLRRRANSSSALRDRDGVGAALGVTRPISPPPEPPPALPDYALALTSSAKLSKQDQLDILSPPTSRSDSSQPMDSAGAFMQSTSGRMLNRSGTMPPNGLPTAGSGMMPPPSATGMQGEAAMVHQHIQEMANKRISTLEYLRKAHEGRVYWFNTLLFDKPDLARMPYFDTRRLARRATNYLLLGLSLPIVIDLNSNTPMEFLRSFNLLLTEFDSFQSLHPEAGGASSGLGRARMPNLNVFRRATPSAKARRSSSATNDTLYENDDDSMMTNGSAGGAGAGGSLSGPAGSGSTILGSGGLGGSASVVSFGQSEADLLPGEEYVHLLTPSLPFDPDFFETFATLCDVLIDAYTRLLGLLSSPRDCNAAVAELFTKADAKVRKIIVQGIVKEFEDTSRNGVRTEVANVGKIVLSGLM